MSLGEQLKNKRSELGLTQGNVAMVLGVKIPQVSLWERGHKPHSHNVEKIKEFFLAAQLYKIQKGRKKKAGVKQCKTG